MIVDADDGRGRLRPHQPQRRQAADKYVMPAAEALMKEMGRPAELERRGIAGLHDILLAALPEPDVK